MISNCLRYSLCHPLLPIEDRKILWTKLSGLKFHPYPPTRPQRIIPGMTKCNKCVICPFIKVGKTVKATETNVQVTINKPVSCQTKNAVYCINCKKCKMQYIGETDRTLQSRFSEHRGYVANQHLAKATGHHFNLPGHSIADMEVTILEKIFSLDAQFRKAREQMQIQSFNTKYKEMNHKLCHC